LAQKQRIRFQIQVNPVRERARGTGPRARIEPDPAASRLAFSNGVNVENFIDYAGLDLIE